MCEVYISPLSCSRTSPHPPHIMYLFIGKVCSFGAVTTTSLPCSALFGRSPRPAFPLLLWPRRSSSDGFPWPPAYVFAADRLWLSLWFWSAAFSGDDVFGRRSSCRGCGTSRASDAALGDRFLSGPPACRARSRVEPGRRCFRRRGFAFAGPLSLLVSRRVAPAPGEVCPEYVCMYIYRRMFLGYATPAATTFRRFV